MQRAYTIPEFCSAYRVGKTKAYQLIGEGRLKAVKVDSKTLIRADDADTWLESLQPLENAAA